MLEVHVNMRTRSLSSSRDTPENAAAGDSELAATAEAFVAATEVVDEKQADRVMEEGTPFHRRILRLESVQPRARQGTCLQGGLTPSCGRYLARLAG